MIICDTNCLISLVNADDQHHEEVRRLAAAQTRPLIVSPLVLAEFDYLVHKVVSNHAARRILSGLLQGGAFRLLPKDGGTRIGRSGNEEGPRESPPAGLSGPGQSRPE
ncbi:type II toxin-antitoxin system VapC family toxin [Glycomyces algeriensis]|uniref:PIN domain-containing protein n=1 Tax=Glycomyces algeriensis TaxID=256037 RepID=A0A9W6G4Q7_9ACTN|nr:PIN domain-containing protein [Glycomyces algeriensis]MDA1366890.1 PIN domain-containing protein [Glycomyces algeriensis]MDR7352724.1 putative nucleic acid-binding protein [Glycomyces algeriensis]GLI40406.1 hypothetical protein GALLR39Z86_02560 [Glycomyces algeriensis]